MLQDLSERLSKAIEQKRLKEKLEKDFRAVGEELQSQSSRMAFLESQLKKEKVDVEKLERISLTYLFYSVLGSREQQLEKVRQELLSAQLGYQQVRHQAEYLAQEKNRLSDQLEKLAGTDSEYKSCLAEKEKFIQQSNQTIAKELFEISEKLANLNSELREISEAMAAGESVVVDLAQAIKSLGGAEGWGIWDMLGGGLITDMIKHSHIDDARISVTNAQKKISQFKRELADVQKSTEVQINIGELASFADFFFDGLIFDWVVQSKIEDSLEKSNKAKSIITQTIKELEALKESTQSEFDDTQEKRVLLIERT
jgi:multidrug efflux pump subunit AcrA (membrane-fusion protein)